LADEPTGNLDSRTGTEIMDLIREFNQSLGMTVVIVTHELVLAQAYVKRLIVLADGKLAKDVPNVASETDKRRSLGTPLQEGSVEISRGDPL
jgi:putative ABC transport system ATP-binding protein